MNLLESLLWLTLNVYHEARSEPEIGQLAVAHVTINRAMQKKKSIREVVLAPYQFSWTRYTEEYVPKEKEAWDQCGAISMKALLSKDFTGGATHYHRVDVSPKWARKLHYLNQYGLHKFYREK